MWRPDDWEESITALTLHWRTYRHKLDRSSIEAGADAILEALKSRVGSKRNKGNSGWFVFIPGED